MHGRSWNLAAIAHCKCGAQDGMRAGAEVAGPLERPAVFFPHGDRPHGPEEAPAGRLKLTAYSPRPLATDPSNASRIARWIGICLDLRQGAGARGGTVRNRERPRSRARAAATADRRHWRIGGWPGGTRTVLLQCTEGLRARLRGDPTSGAPARQHAWGSFSDGARPCPSSTLRTGWPSRPTTCTSSRPAPNSVSRTDPSA